MKKLVTGIGIGFLGFGFYCGVIKHDYAQGAFYLTFSVLCIVANKTEK